MSKNVQVYEQNQRYNIVTRTLHHTRYANLEKLARKAAGEVTGPLRILDIGCGVAKSFEVLSRLGFDFTYTGVEPEPELCRRAEERYGANENFRVICGTMENHAGLLEQADLIIALETFEHIPEGNVVRLVEAIGKASFKYLYVTVPNEIGPAILMKNVGSFLMGYPRYKEYSWAETFHAAFYNLDKVGRHDVNHKGFDWRWLAQTLRQNVTIVGRTTSPANFVPRVISPSIGFICVPG